jgi:ATP-binding cassette subfamily B protein
MEEIYKHKDDAPADDTTVVEVPAYSSLRLANLSFRYPGAGQAEVLRGVDLVIPVGKVTAIVGASGSGKTTLFKLLLGLYKPTAGDIYVGHVPLRSIESRAWTSRCGAVMQDGYIFSGSLARNIAPGSAAINPMLLNFAIRLANLEEYISALPHGVNTLVGAEGQGLSGGQKQRVLLARAIYRDPDFLFLDEATSALDANNERTVMENLREFSAGRTLVVIAHRLSTVQDADQIVVLDQGKIIEIGSHGALVAQGGAYFRLVRNQLQLETTAAPAE